MTRLRHLRLVLKRDLRRGRRYQPRFQLGQIGVTSLAALSAVMLLGLLTLWSGQVLIVAPLGASCVLLFGYPASPLAQPRNIVLGNLIGGLVGVSLARTAGQGPAVVALAVGITIFVGSPAAMPASPCRGNGVSGGAAQGSMDVSSVSGVEWIDLAGAAGLGF